MLDYSWKPSVAEKFVCATGSIPCKKQGDALKVSVVLFSIVTLIWIGVVCVNFYKYHDIPLTISYFFNLQGEFSFSVFVSLLLGYIIALAAALAVTFSAFFAGSCFFSLLKLDFTDKYENMLFATAAGLGLIAYMTVIIGYLGGLHRWVFYIIFSALMAAGIVRIRNVNRQFHQAVRFSKTDFFEKIMISMLILLAVFNLLMSLTPEMFYDSLNYHLGVPNYFIQNHRISPLPYKILSNFPLNISMLFTAGMLLKNYTAAKLLNFIFGILIAAGIMVFSIRRLKNRLSGIIAAVVFYFTPTVMFRSWLASNDIGLTLFIFFSLYALINYMDGGERNPKWLFAAAVLSGFALGSKYTAVFFIAPLAFVLMIHEFFAKQALKKIFKSVALFTVITAAVASPWFIRNYINSGNPVHPLMTQFFNIKYPYGVSAETEFNYHNPLKQSSGIITLFSLPWNMSIKGGGPRTNYASPDYYMSGAVFIGFMPLLLFFRIRKKNAVVNLLLFFIFSFLIWGIAPNTKFKYFSPALPAAGLLIGYVVCASTRESEFLKNIFGISIIVMAMSNFLFMIPMAVSTYQPLSLISGTISKDKYLSDSRPGYPYPSYNVYKYANETLPEDAKILIFGDAKCLYINRRFAAFSVEGLNPLIEYLRNSGSGDEVYLNLKSDGFTHLIVNAPEGIRTAGYGNFYFNKEDIVKLDGFWKKYITELYQYGGVYLYRIKKTPDSGGTPGGPYNSAAGAFRNYKLNNVKGNFNSKNWKSALIELDALLDKNIRDHWIFYLKAVCSYNLNDYSNAMKYTAMAYAAAPKPEYKELLEKIKERKPS